MAEENHYEVKTKEKKAEDIETIIDKGIQEKPQVVEVEEQAQKQPKPQSRKMFQIPQIPADKVFKTLTDKDMMMQTLHDETLEPHVHLVILLFIIFILAIIIGIIGAIVGI